jgi:O-antigen/teichoic acid export membrane protein
MRDMSQARLVLRNTAVLGAARIIERTSGLVLALLISRELGVAALGVYATATAYFALISQAGEAGATNLLIREISKDRTRTSAYIVHTSLMASALSLALMGVAWGGIPLLGYSPELTQALNVIVLAILPGTLNTIQEAAFIAHQRTEFETLTTFVGSVIRIGASVALLASGYGVVSLVVALVAVEYAATLAYFVIINRFIVRLRWELSRAFALDIVREIRSFTGLSLLGGVFARPEVIILSLVASEVQVGFYTAALKIVDLFQFIPQVYMTNVYPVLARSFHVADGRFQEIQDLALKYLLALALPLSAGLLFAAEPIIEAFYGPGFDRSVVLLQILALNLPLYCLHSVLWRALAARGRQGLVLRVQVVSTIARVSAGTAVISALKSLGAAITVPAALVLHTALLTWKLTGHGVRVPLARLAWRFAAAAVLMGLVVLLLADSVRLFALVPAAALVYAGLLALLRPFSSDEIAFVKTLLRPRFVRSQRPG